MNMILKKTIGFFSKEISFLWMKGYDNIKSLLKKSTVMLCMCLIACVLATSCDKLKNLQDGIEEGRLFDPRDTIPEVIFTEDAFMDTLKGDWSWFQKYGGIGGNTWNNEFKSVIKILSQNADTSINYEVFVDDTLFYQGSFQIQHDQWNRRFANIKLPHETWLDSVWQVYFFNILEIEYNEEKGVFENKPNKDTLTLWDGVVDGYYYIYRKIK